MLPLQFLLLTVHPVVVMQLRHRDGVLDLRIVRTHGLAKSIPNLHISASCSSR
jgi:hypothetical protein